VLGYLGTIVLGSSFGNSGRIMYILICLKLGLEVLNVIRFDCYVDCIKRDTCVRIV
jgi:hypothetical protein